MSTSSLSLEKSNTISAPRGRAPAGARRGQSFIEAMVAITVIVTSIASALALVQASITASRISGHQVVAANLAREGLEVVRSFRDTNWLKSQSFQVGLVDVGGVKSMRPLLDLDGGVWTPSFAATSLSNANAAVYLTPSGVFVQADSQPSGSTVTPYTRVVSLQHICRETTTGVERIVGGAVTCLGSETLVGLAVISSVRHRGVSGNFQTLDIEERLYDWR